MTVWWGNSFLAPFFCTLKVSQDRNGTGEGKTHILTMSGLRLPFRSTSFTRTRKI